MRLKTTILAAITLSALAANAFAQGTGRSLDIQPGARQNGMGAAGVALGDDATGATWWNPAALAFMQHPAVQLTYAQLVPGLASDVSYNYGTYVQPMEGWGAFGLGIVFLDYGLSDQITESGENRGQFGSNEFSPALYYGTKLLPDFAVGASLKYIRIQLAPSSLQGVGSTFGLDLAGLYRIPAARLKLGVNVQNLGPSVTFINEDQASPLSRNVKAGLAWDFLSGKTFGGTLAADFNQSLVTNDFRTYHGGVELRYGGQSAGLGNIGVAGRIGYYDDPLGEIQDLTYGVGISWARVGLDFGSIPQAKNSGLSNVSKITLGYRF
jgi:type IX secretion system protein PorV